MPLNRQVNCPSDEHLQAFLREHPSAIAGETVSVDYTQVASHLSQCTLCRSRLEDVSKAFEHDTVSMISPLDAGTTGFESGSVKNVADVSDETLDPDATERPEPGDVAWGSMQGRQFGEYEILEEVARGGMGVVYKARQLRADRVVALKLIQSGQLSSPSELIRFQTEINAAASLDHPNIVPIFDVGELDGQHYYTMAFIDGTTLTGLLMDGPLPSREAASLIKQVALAVDYAHSRNIVHRDLKPANVLIDADGTPKLADFGLARVEGADSGLTVTGQILGTPSYMPPEQALGNLEDIGPHSDVYSVGATLYGLLTVRPPFQASNPIDTLRQVVEDDPIPPSAINPSVDRDLETICLKCLQKSIDRRYATASDIADDLQRYLDDIPIVARPVSRRERIWRWCRRNPTTAVLSSLATVAMVATLVVSVAFAVYSTNTSRTLGQQKGELETKGKALTQALSEVGLQKSEAENSRDLLAKRLAETMYMDAQRSCVDGESHLGLLMMTEALSIVPENATRLAEGIRLGIGDWASRLPCVYERQMAAGGSAFNLASEGNLVAVPGAYLRVMNTETGIITWIPDSRCDRVSLHPAGTYVAGSARGRPNNHTKIWRLADRKLVREITGSMAVAWSPDGEHYVAQRQDEVFKGFEKFRVADLETGQVEVLASKDGLDGDWQLDYHPDGSVLVAKTTMAIDMLDAQSLQHVQTVRQFQPWASSYVILEDQVGLVVQENLRVVNFGENATITNTPLKGVEYAVFDPFRRQLIVGNRKGIRFIDPTTWKDVAPGFRVDGGVNGLAVTADGKHLAIQGGTGEVYIWRLLDPPRKHSLRTQVVGRTSTATFNSAHDLADGRLLVRFQYYMRGGQLPLQAIFNPMDGTIDLFETRIDGIATLNTPPSFGEGRWMVGHQGQRLYEWDTATGAATDVILSASDPPLTRLPFDKIYIDSTSGYVIVAHQDGVARVWDRGTGLPVGPSVPITKGFPPVLNSVKPEMYLLAPANNGPYCPSFRTIEFPPQEGQPRVTEFDAIRFLKASPNGQWVAAKCGIDESLVCWNLNQMDKPFKLPVTGVQVSYAFANDDRVATVSNQGRIKVWDLVTRREIGRTMNGSAQEDGTPVTIFSPSGDLVLAGNQPTQLWHSFTGLPVGPALLEDSAIRGTHIDRNGNMFFLTREGEFAVERLPVAPVGDAEDVRWWLETLTCRKLGDDQMLVMLDLQEAHKRVKAGEETEVVLDWPPPAHAPPTTLETRMQHLARDVHRLEVEGLWPEVIARLEPLRNDLNDDLLARLGRAYSQTSSPDSLSKATDVFEQLNDANDMEGMRFTGLGERVETPNIPFQDFGAFTIEAWFQDWDGPLVHVGRSGAENCLSIFNAPTNPMAVGWDTGDKNKQPLIRGFRGDGRPHHLAVVWDGTHASVYFDGLRQISKEMSPPDALKNRMLWIGGVEKSPAMRGRGTLQSLRVSSNARYTQPPEDPFDPVTDWEVDEQTELLLDFRQAVDAQGKITDSSGKGRDGMVRLAWWLKPNPPTGWRPENWLQMDTVDDNVTKKKTDMGANAEMMDVLVRSLGFVTDQLAMGQQIPMGKVESLANQLAASGYRPISLRPWQRTRKSKTEMLYAGCWVRDSTPSSFTLGAPTNDLAALLEAKRKEGFVPIDVSVHQSDPTLSTIVWRQAQEGEEATAVADATYEKYRLMLSDARKRGLERANLVTWQPKNDAESHWTAIFAKPLPHSTYVAAAKDLLAIRETRDLQATLCIRQHTNELHYTGMFVPESGFTSAISTGLTPSQHLARCKAFAKHGYRPHSVEARQLDNGNVVSASLWHRPR